MSPDPAMLTASTSRISIRPAGAGDIEPTFAYRSLGEVTEWLPRTAPDFDAYNAAFVEQPRFERTLVIEHEGEVVGDLYLHVRDAWVQAEVAHQGVDREAEIGWVLNPAWGGRGLATEAVTTLIDVCFGRLGVHRVVATCHALNVPSWRLMERVGMRRETHSVQASLHRKRGWIDGYTYALLDEEWQRGSRLR